MQQFSLTHLHATKSRHLSVLNVDMCHTPLIKPCLVETSDPKLVLFVAKIFYWRQARRVPPDIWLAGEGEGPL